MPCFSWCLLWYTHNSRALALRIRAAGTALECKWAAAGMAGGGTDRAGAMDAAWGNVDWA